MLWGFQLVIELSLRLVDLVYDFLRVYFFRKVMKYYHISRSDNWLRYFYSVLGSYCDCLLDRNGPVPIAHLTLRVAYFSLPDALD